MLHDLEGDGRWELVVIALKDKRASLTTIFEAVVTRGLDAVLEIRRFEENQRFADRPTASIDFTLMLPTLDMVDRGPLVFFDGDFNGDTRRELIVFRSPTHMQIFLSSQAGRFFERRSALGVDIPFAGETALVDLNGDELSDIVVLYQKTARIAFMLSGRKGARR